MSQNPDLFPQTLVCYVRDGVVYTNSVNVAQFSQKRHTHVLRAIETKLKVLPSRFTEPNFGLSEYTDSTGRKLPMYEMTEEGFALTMMGFTGKEAVQWQVDFIEQFVAQRAELEALKARESNALYTIRPRWKFIVQNPGMARVDLIGLTGHKSPGSITSCRRSMRQAGLLD